MLGYIYCYENKLNGKRYVGKTISIHKRKIVHKSYVKSGKKNDFYDAVRSVSWDNFKFSVLETSKDIEDLDEFNETLSNMEIHWMKELDSVENGYNPTLDGVGGKYQGKESHTKEYKNITILW